MDRRPCLCAKSPPTAGSAATAHQTDNTPTAKPEIPKALDIRPFSPLVSSDGPSSSASASASAFHEADTGVAVRLAG